MFLSSFSVLILAHSLPKKNDPAVSSAAVISISNMDSLYHDS